MFEGNVGLMVGVIVVVNGNVMFDKCNFCDNFGNKIFGYVYLGYGIGWIYFKDCLFLIMFYSIVVNGVFFKKLMVLYFESGGLLEIENILMVLNVS